MRLVNIRLSIKDMYASSLSSSYQRRLRQVRFYVQFNTYTHADRLPMAGKQKMILAILVYIIYLLDRSYHLHSVAS